LCKAMVDGSRCQLGTDRDGYCTRHVRERTCKYVHCDRPGEYAGTTLTGDVYYCTDRKSRPHPRLRQYGKYSNNSVYRQSRAMSRLWPCRPALLWHSRGGPASLLRSPPVSSTRLRQGQGREHPDRLVRRSHVW
jgi:hypothetical protein